MPVPPVGSDSSQEPRWRVVFVFLLLLAGLYLVGGPKVHLSQWHVSPTKSHGLIEAMAWRDGRLDLPPTSDNPLKARLRDSAYRDGKVYNVFPPLFTFMCYAALKLQQLQGITGAAADQIYAPWYVGTVALSLPCVGFWAFRVVTQRSEWAAVLTAYWILGTPLLPMLGVCREGSVNEINHVLSNVALLLVAGDLLGKRRIWPSALGLVIGAWTRQLTLLYLFAMIWVVWRFSAHRRRDLTVLACAAMISVAVLCGLNWAKFGSPFDTGYASIYEGRTDLYARRVQQYGGVFDIRFVPRNLYYMTLALPSIRESRLRVFLTGHWDGTAIWFTSPLVALGIWNLRRWWGDTARRALMLSSFAVILGFLCYHNTGSVQRGYYRFALDFIPVWMAVVAPYIIRGRQQWFVLGALAWSALYFRTLST